MSTHNSARTRVVLAVALAIALLVGTACSSNASTSSTTSSTPTTAPTVTTQPTTPLTPALTPAAAAYIWGYPLVVTERTMQTLALRVGVNQLVFQPTISDVTSRSVVAPNTDTLYGVAILDLRGEPFVLKLPAIHDRYYSFQFISAYTDSFAYIGTRGTGGRAGTWLVTPPGWHGTVPAGATRIAAPTSQVVLLGRFLVKNPGDVDRIHALGKEMHLQPLSTVTGMPRAPAPPPIGTPSGTPQGVAVAGARFFDELGDALAINPPVDAQELATMRGFAALGVGPGKHPSTTAQRRVLRQGVIDGEATLARSVPTGNTVVDGWSVDVRTGVYGHDALLRAVTARGGWGANVPAEAVYTHANGDVTGAPLSGAHDYVIHFAQGGLPPVNAFWSMTLYGPDHFFVANPINRYAIGDRTTGLHYGAVGSLDIYLQHGSPAGHASNWLPTPTGNYYLSLRLYLPKPSVLDGTYHYPKIERVR